MKLKSYILLFFFILVSVNFIYSAGENSSIKRKIVILPFYNKNSVSEYDYLADVIMETLRSDLIGTDKYEFTNFSDTEEKLSGKNYKGKDFINLKIAKETAVQLNADVVITGQYVIIENHIMIMIHTVDIITGQLVALTRVEGGTGVEMFDLINKAASDMTAKITEKLPMLEKNKTY